MGIWKIIATLVVFVLSNGDCTCTVRHRESCEYYVNCTDDLENIGELYAWISNSCYHKKILYNLKNVDINLWPNERRYFADYAIKITLSHVDKFPDLPSSSTLKTIVLTDWLNKELDLICLTGRDLSALTNIDVSYNHIEFLVSDTCFESHSNRIENIDISHNQLKTLPINALYGFQSLKYLNLSHNAIDVIEVGEFINIDQLEVLDISYNRLIEIADSFAKFVNMKEIFLNNNNLSVIVEPNFRTMSNLEKLNLSTNLLVSVEDDAFRTLLNLEEIDLSNNMLTKISRVLFWSNTKMHKMIAKNNKIEIIESEAFKGKNITSFDISNNDLRGSIQSNCFRGINTYSLNLSNGKIVSLEEEAFAGLITPILNLSNNALNNIAATAFKSVNFLGELDLSSNNLSTINFETTDLRQLLIFNASKNKLRNISHESLSNFVSLSKLDLSYNQISALEPQLFSKLSKLKFLDLSHNLVTGSLKVHFFEGLSSVTTILLNDNRFTTIENETFYGLNSLEILNCAHSELSNIESEAFKNTNSIQKLDLSHNLLESFLINSETITSIKELNLNNNQIRKITSKSLSGLKHLEKIYLANNNIMTLEYEIFRTFSSLRILDLSNNAEINIKDVLGNITVLSHLKIASIKKQFDFKDINNKSISSLDLSNNDIENINEVFVFRISKLEYLDLQKNKITVIDKYSFQSMLYLKYLDLSSNLIKFIQPGSFSQTINLKMLNLHKNALPSVQFGVLDGLYALETLNLSNNALHEFRRTLLHNTPMISTIALDNNVIENIKFEEFVPSKIKLITIGGNLISCHDIADFKLFNISAENLIYHGENVRGVSCINPNFNTKVWFQNATGNGGNETTLVWMIQKEIESNRALYDRALTSLDRIDLKNELKENKDIQKSMLSILTSINKSLKESNTLSVERHLKDVVSSEKVSKGTEDEFKRSKTGDANFDDHLEEKIRLLNEEKNKMVKELQDVFVNLKNNRFNNMAQTNANENNDLKGVLYFMASCLFILVVLTVAIIFFKYFKPRNMFKRNNVIGSGSSQLANIIELQEN